MRTASVARKTKETDIEVMMNLDGSGLADIQTGVGFFDHMLTALSVHSGIDLTVRVKGDLAVDCHHTIEDAGIVLGTALKKALETSAPIERYGSAYVPMDEALGFAALDVSGRPFLVFQCEFAADRIGDMDTQMAEEFFRAFAFQAGVTLHLRAEYGKNDHHKAEALFKALAHSLKQALALRPGRQLLSTKGVL
ncbi:MAG: imidazoleglycerol-phosphate dehydratase HisB [Oscillospiraceae bacterium]|jgi:imidazoleglycerol-phosphate dehydratase|nr:imidazoleglycerol-phosphate dehydratase HisB [Oscillospiraceae bacterium]